MALSSRAGLRLHRLGAPMMLDGSIDGLPSWPMQNRWWRHNCRPATSSPWAWANAEGGATLGWSDRRSQPIQDAGAGPLLLPLCSLEDNPVETVFGKLKAPTSKTDRRVSMFCSNQKQFWIHRLPRSGP